MHKKSFGVMILAFYGFIVGIVNVLSCIFYPSFYFSIVLVISLICGILSFGLIKLLNWARVAIFIFSLFVIFLVLFLFYGTVIEMIGYRQTWVFLELVRIFPLLLFCLSAIYYLSRPNVKKRFLDRK